jgi:hypothetical protein
VTYDFPDDLRKAQRAIREVRADLAALLKALPYSVEPMEAWARPEGYWLATSPAHPDSAGWSQEEQQEVAALRDRERDLAIAIVTHGYWSQIDAGDRPKARDALKRVLDSEGQEAA